MLLPVPRCDATVTAVPHTEPEWESDRMDLILIILIIVLLFGGGFGYRRYGHRGGIGIGGILLLILILYLIFGHGRV